MEVVDLRIIESFFLILSMVMSWKIKLFPNTLPIQIFLQLAFHVQQK